MKTEKEVLKEVEQTAAAFASRHIEPIKDRVDHGESRFPAEVFNLGLDAGFDRFLIPEEFGGHGMEMPELCALIGALARCCAGHAMVFGVHAAALKSILDAEADKAHRMLGAILGARKPVAVAVPEVLSADEFETGVEAFPDAEGYHMTGPVGLALNVSHDGFLMLLAKVRAGSPVAILLRCGLGGNAPLEKPERSIGLRAMTVSTVTLENCYAPRSQVIAEGESVKVFYRALLSNMCMVAAAAASGLASSAYENAVKYAAERYQGGKMIIDHTHLRSILGSMAVRTKVSPASVAHAQDRYDDLSSVLSAKIATTDGAVLVARDAVQVLGGYGYMREFGLEKAMRDAAVLSLLPMSNLKAEQMIAELEKKRLT